MALLCRYRQACLIGTGQQSGVHDTVGCSIDDFECVRPMPGSGNDIHR